MNDSLVQNATARILLRMAKIKRMEAERRELLAALQAMIATFEQDGWTGTGSMQAQRGTVLTEARAAIAKAGGGK